MVNKVDTKKSINHSHNSKQIKPKTELSVEELERKKEIRESFRKNNYRKYLIVKDSMLKILNEGQSTLAQACIEAGISLQTFLKYKCILQIETGQNLTTIDERRFLRKL